MDGASYNSDNYLNKPYHGIAGVGNGQATDNGDVDNLEAYKQAVKENPEATFICTSGARQPVYFHSEHRQLPWCRELWPVPRMEINPADAERLGIEQGDWCWIETEFGKIRETADLYYGVPQGVVNLEHQWWYPEITEPGRGFQFSAVNQLISPDDGDPLCGSSNLRAYYENVYKATEENSPYGNPCPCLEDGTEIIHDASDARLKDWAPVYEGRDQ